MSAPRRLLASVFGPDLAADAGRWARRAAAMLEAADLPDLTAPPPSTRAPGRAAVVAALDEWARDIIEPARGLWSPAIGGYYREAGWTWRARYTGQSSKWCGIFAGVMLRRAGLDREVVYRHLPSCSRLLSAYQSSSVRRALRIGDADDLRPGDVLVVGRPGAHKAGEHITLVEHVDGERGVALTVEGNARGLGPGAPGRPGVVREGVVRRTRPLTREAAAQPCPMTGLPQSMLPVHRYRWPAESYADADRTAWPYVGGDDE